MHDRLPCLVRAGHPQEVGFSHSHLLKQCEASRAVCVLVGVRGIHVLAELRHGGQGALGHRLLRMLLSVASGAESQRRDTA